MVVIFSGVATVAAKYTGGGGGSARAAVAAKALVMARRSTKGGTVASAISTAAIDAPGGLGGIGEDGDASGSGVDGSSVAGAVHRTISAPVFSLIVGPPVVVMVRAEAFLVADVGLVRGARAESQKPFCSSWFILARREYSSTCMHAVGA